MISRYSVPEINEIFLDKNKFDKWLLVEKAVLKYFVKKGYFSEKKYEQLSDELTFTQLEVFLEEQITKHDFVAFLNVISRKTSCAEKKWIHYGLTSSDVVDTGNSLLLREVNDLLISKLKELQITLKELAFKYKDLPQVGRTHGVHAEITSFGYKFAIYYSDLKRELKNFSLIRRSVECVMISGSVGTYANTSLELQDFLSEELDLYSSNCSTQVLSRERYASYFSCINIIGQTIHKIAYDLRHLTKTEVNEVNEKFSEGQIGSSSMPHKKNPISLENICGLSRLLKGYSISSIDNISLWHERDISHSSVERVLFLDATTILYTICNKLNDCLKNISVNEVQIMRNIQITKDNIFSQTALLKLISKLDTSREKLHEEIQKISKKSYENATSFQEELKNSKFSKELTKEEFENIFSYKYHLQYIDKIYERVFGNEKYKSHFSEILWDNEEILNAIYKLSCFLNKEYENSSEEVVLLTLMEGSMVFTGHLLPFLTFPTLIKSIHLSGYGNETTISNKNLDDFLEKIDLTICQNKRILVLDDLIDSGHALNTLKHFLNKFSPQDLKICTLFKKENDENTVIKVDWWGLKIPNSWVAGFGIDSKGRYRNLDFIGVLKDEYKDEIV